MVGEHIDGMVMSTLDTFEITGFDEYDREYLELLDKDNNGGNESLWNYPPFNNVSDLMNVPLVDDHAYLNSRFNRKELHKGMLFVRKESLIYACQMYSIKNRVEYRTIRSGIQRLNLVCRGGSDNCQWNVGASVKKKSSMWEITEYCGDHTCEVDIIPRDNVHFNKHFIGMEVQGLIKERLRFSPKQIIALMREKFNYTIKYMKAWKARQSALKFLFGDWEESFARLPAYMNMLQELNPGSIVFWNKSSIDGNKVMVDRVFWAFSPAIEAFTHCRPVISIDATHLFGKYKGVLMIAIALDANNQLLPIAYALAESENIESWKWFMSCIRAGVTQREGLCVISDRHIGIMRAMEDIDWSPPKAYHRICVRHFASNFRQKVKTKDQIDLLKFMAYENQQKKFLQRYGDLRDLLKNNIDALRWLDRVNVDKWTMSYDLNGMRWGSMTTNASECFNNVLKGGRDLPITALVHFTFKQVNNYFVARREQFYDHNKFFTPMIESKLAKYRQKAGCHKVQMYDRDKGVATVITGFSCYVHTVRIEEKSCTCGKWQIFHYPCSHVLAVCAQEGLSIRSCVAHEYTMEAFRATWAPIFQPIPDVALWREYDGPKHVPNKHFKNIKKGRPSTKRRPNEMDERSVSQGSRDEARLPKRIFKCSICKATGHTKKTCNVIN